MREVACYKYHDQDGRELYEVVRFDPKEFRCRRIVNGQQEWGLGNLDRVLYRLPQILAEADRTIILCEGEKAVDALVHHNLLATCSPGGAGKWHDRYSRWLEGRSVVILADNDEPGRQHAQDVYQRIRHHGLAAIVELPGLPEKGDVVDWLAQGNTRNQLVEHCQEALRIEEILNGLATLPAPARWRAVDMLLQAVRTAPA